jgi:hypothetical protein
MDTIHFQLIDTATGEILFDAAMHHLISPKHERKPGVERVPGVKVYKGDLLILRADDGSGWRVVDSFTDWVQLETFEQRTIRLNRHAAATAFGHFYMVDRHTLDALGDADAYRFLMLLPKVFVKTRLISNITSVAELSKFWGLTRPNTYSALERLTAAGLISQDGSDFKVTGGLHRKRKQNSLIVFRAGLWALKKQVKNATKHSYMGRLFKHVTAAADGMVQPQTPDTKARRYFTTLSMNALPVLWKDADGYKIAPTVAFLGKPQQWPSALNKLAALKPRLDQGHSSTRPAGIAG